MKLRMIRQLPTLVAGVSLVTAGCGTTRGVSRGPVFPFAPGFNEARPMAAAEWQGVKKLRVHVAAHSKVATTERDWGATVLAAVLAARGGAIAVTEELIRGKGRDDSAGFSGQIRQSLGGWRLIDVFQRDLEAAIRARSSIALETLSLGDELRAAGRAAERAYDLAPSARSERQGATAEQGTNLAPVAVASAHEDASVKELDAMLMLNFTGTGSPRLDMSLGLVPGLWALRQPAMAQAPRGAPTREANSEGAFEVQRLYVQEGMRDSWKQFRFYRVQTPAHARTEWIGNNCEVLKDEIEKGVQTLCSQMAKDMFP